jgi:peptide/nickel transport system ATP-binding protein
MPPGKIVQGEILYKGTNLVGQNERYMRKKRGGDITMIFQDPMTSLNPLISVGNQIMEVVLLHENLSKLEATKRAKMMLETVGIPGDRYNDFPYQFSGGMKQRVMIAMALACDPRFLIADEPTTALDVTIQAQVLKLMNNLKKERNTAVLLITHDLGVVAEVCNRVAVMYAGHIVENGPVEQIFNDMRHPYTQGLFFAIPDLDSESEFLKSLEGLMPDPMHLPEGCPFHPRCSHCMEKCKTEVPPNLEVTPGHLVKCHLYP